jgi:hypothetical protein
LAGTGLCACLVAAGLLYRVYQVPAEADALAISGFERSIPTFDQGRQARGTTAQFRRADQEVQAFLGGRAGTDRRGGDSSDGTQFERAARRGWDQDSEALKPWLDGVFASEWGRQLDEIRDQPPGIYEDPREVDVFTPPDAIRDLRDMLTAIRCRINQSLAEGREEECLGLLRTGLAFVRSGRTKTRLACALVALEQEELLLKSLHEWLSVAGKQPLILHSLLNELLRHHREMPRNIEEVFWAEEIVLRNTMDRVASWLPRILDPAVARGSPASSGVEAESELVSVAWSVPWEKARRERLLLLHSQSQSGSRVPPEWLSGLHLRNWWKSDRTNRLLPLETAALALRRLALLQVALRLYQLEHGKPPAELKDLVPAYLQEVSSDPYTGQPIHYRISTGEILNPLVIDRREAGNLRAYYALGVVSALSHPVGGWNGLWAVSEALEPPPRESSLPLGKASAGIGTLPTSSAAAVYRPTRIPVGTCVIWCVGPDLTDDGGKRTNTSSSVQNKGRDLVVIVPPVASALAK